MNNLFKTKDLGISACLLSLNFKLIKTDWNGKEVFFYFDNEVEASKIAHQYYFGWITVEAKVFHDNLVLLKREILAKYNPTKFRKDVRIYASR